MVINNYSIPDSYQEPETAISENSGISLQENNINKEIIESEALLRLMMDSIPHGTWTNTPDGNVTFYNEHFYNYTGLDKNKPKEKAWEGIIHSEDIKSTHEQYQHILKGDTGGEFENRVRRKDGQYRWHLSRIRPIKNSEGKIFLWIGSSTDVHDMKLLQQYKDDFINIASHELKTPITSLKVSIELLNTLRDDKMCSMYDELLDMANRNVLRVNNLVNDLLNAGKINKGQLEIQKIYFNLSGLVNEIVNQSKHLGNAVVIIKGNVNRTIFGDEIRISQVLMNLVTNAFKYAPESKAIIISIEQIEDFIKISVTDEGKGVEKDFIPLMFNRYIQEETRCAGDGLGLGLYICNEIILKHGGKMGAECKELQGTTVWFTLPIS